MTENTKRLSRLALLAALGVGLLAVGSVLPTAQLTLLAVAGFLSAVAVMMYSPLWATSVYVVVAALSLLLLPEKSCAVYYTAFFGYYPILKSFFEKIRDRRLSWLAKLGAFTAVFLVWCFLGAGLFLGNAVTLRWYALWPLGAAAFAVYDICLSFLITFYIQKISGYIK